MCGLGDLICRALGHFEKHGLCCVSFEASACSYWDCPCLVLLLRLLQSSPMLSRSLRRQCENRIGNRIGQFSWKGSNKDQVQLQVDFQVAALQKGAGSFPIPSVPPGTSHRQEPCKDEVLAHRVCACKRAQCPTWWGNCHALL